MGEIKTPYYERYGSETPISNSTRFVEYTGLNSVTVRNQDQHPYFFLFADIDSKESERLRKILQFYKSWHLSTYYYESVKGWHVLSPDLLHLRKWMRLSSILRPYLDYSFDTIRWSRRFLDGNILYFEEWNRGKDFESYDFHYTIVNKFHCRMNHIRPWYTSSTLNWCLYNQLRINKEVLL